MKMYYVRYSQGILIYFNEDGSDRYARYHKMKDEELEAFLVGAAAGYRHATGKRIEEFVEKR